MRRLARAVTGARRVGQAPPDQGVGQRSARRSRGGTRIALARRVLIAIMLLGVVTTPTRDARARPEQARHPLSSAEQTAEVRRRAPPPVAIAIDAAGVQSPVETREIVAGALPAPSGPWVVAWYRQSARPGESGNVVMGGHVDYWTVGPAVFSGLGTLAAGEQIKVTDAAGTAYTYAVEWVRAYPVAELTPAQLRQIVGPTAEPSLTLITCGGVFDRDRGEYLMRLVVRAARVAR